MTENRMIGAACACLLAAGAMAGQGTLPVAGPLYWLDVSDSAHVTYNAQTGEILTLTDKSGNGIDFERRTNHYSGASGYLGPTYMQTPGTNSPPSGLPYARFNLLTNFLVQATARTTSPRTVFIVQKTTGNSALGGIWGRWGSDQGIRLWGATGPGGAWQWVYDEITYFKNRDFIISYQIDDSYWTDLSLFDQRQTWFNKQWGVTTAYGNHTYGQTSLGVYYETRWWGGCIGEVIVYDRLLGDDERRAVETYLKVKWLIPRGGLLLKVR